MAASLWKREPGNRGTSMLEDDTKHCSEDRDRTLVCV
jgi:hypothetical protein